MTAIQWDRARDVITEALARPSQDRDRFVAEHYPDPATREEVSAMLHSCESNSQAGAEPFADYESGDDATTSERISGSRRVGPYEFEQPIGHGGMGQVFLAHDGRLDRRVAIKVLSRARSAPADLRRVMREAGAAAQLNDPRIAAVYDVLETDDRAFIVMEYVPGLTLGQYSRKEPLPPGEVARIGAQIAAALVHAHAAGVVHCDLKPANIKITGDGAIKILDFGLARRATASSADAATTTAIVAGTPGYMSPEQLLGRGVDARSDLYSVGVILYELAVGVRPFRGSDIVALAVAAVSEPPPPLPPSVPDNLKRVIARCLEKDPEARFQSASELRDALTPLAGIAAPTRPALRRRAWLASAAAAIILSAAGVAVWHGGTRESPRVVAILPFTGGDRTTITTVATGLADLLGADLADARGVVVLPRGAAAKFPSGAAAFPIARRDLGADHALTGVVEDRDGATVATISLVTLDSGAAVWSREFSAPAGDIAALEQRIAEAARPRLGATPTAHAPRPTLDREAFEDYAQGRVFLDRVDDLASIDRAVKLFESAAARDRRFALAYAAIGEAHVRRFEITRDTSAIDQARDATLEALRLDPNQAMVRYTLATISRSAGKHDEAIEELRKALALQPSNDEIHRLLGRIYGELGRTDDAIAELTIAKTLRPGFWNTYRALGIVYYRAGRYPDAIREFTRATELQPDSGSGFQMLGTAYHAAGDYEHAVASYRQANSLTPNANAWANIGMIRHSQQRYGEAVDAYKQAVALRPREAVTYRNLGDAYTRLPDPAAARTAYRRAIELVHDQLKVNPTDASLIALEGLCEAKLGNGDRAASLVARAAALAPTSGDVLYKRAVVDAVAGRTGDALAALRDAFAHGASRKIAGDDEDLQNLRGLPEFTAIVGTP